jgi:hypothetical protein
MDAAGIGGGRLVSAQVCRGAIEDVVAGPVGYERHVGLRGLGGGTKRKDAEEQSCEPCGGMGSYDKVFH